MTNKRVNQLLQNISSSPKKEIATFLALSLNEQAYILYRLNQTSQIQVLNLLSDDQIIEIFECLDPDEATDLVQLLPETRQKKLIKKFSEHLKSSVKILKEFDPTSAAGLMSLEYIQVDYNDKIREVAEQVKVHESRTGKLPTIIITKENKIIGQLQGHVLGLAKPSELARKYLSTISTIDHNSSHEQVIEVFERLPHNKLAVIGRTGSVIGIIYSDDIIKIIKEQSDSSLYDFAGVNNEETVSDGVLKKVKSRYKWLIINMGTAFLASFTVKMFESTIDKFVLLAVYMPIVAGMGGNAGTQTLAILVRGIALKQIELKTALPTLRREVLAAICNGLINATIVATIVMILHGDIRLAVVLAFAMVFNLMVAGFAGTLIPLIMNKLGKDPATSATIFITTATDVLGFMAFLGSATLILQN